MEQTLDVVDVGTLLDHGHWTLYAKMLTVLTATAVMFDGFDLQVLGFSIPSLVKEWHAARGVARHPQQWPKLGRFLNRMGHHIAGNSSFEDRTEASNRKRASLRELFADGLGRETAGIWVAFYFSLFAIYLVFGWLPTLLTAQGLDIVSASSGLALFNLGGVFGVLIWAVLVTMLGSRGPLLAASAGCAACALAVWAAPVSSSGSHWMLMAALTATGMLANALQTGLFALVTHIYPLGIRATGVAYAASTGRIGGLLSSLFGAALLAAGLSTFWPVFALAMLCVFAGLALVRGHIPGGNIERDLTTEISPVSQRRRS